MGHVHLPPGLRPPRRPPRRRRPRWPAGSATTCTTTPTAATPPTPGATSNGGTRSPSPRDYRVTLRRGEVDPAVGKYLGGGGPDLGVIIEVAGVVYGPSPVVRNTHRPIWDYTFPRPIRWKLGDPVTIRIIDYDWSDNDGLHPQQPQGRPPRHAAALRHRQAGQGGEDDPGLRLRLRPPALEPARVT